jgi:predicted  nucleic acid-binding Zn-ribbon protein
LEDATELSEDLQEKLSKAKADLASSREESKAARKLLTDCNIKHKQLQQQYQELTKEKKDLQMSLRKEAAKRKGLEQLRSVTWLPHKINELVEQHTKAEEELQRLRKENVDLHACCENFLKLASKSVEAM